MNTPLKPQLHKHGVTRSAFLKFKFPILPYCEVKRGPSTQFNESFHIHNKNTGIILNFYWRHDDTVSVGRVNLKETDLYKKNYTVLKATHKFNTATIIDFCSRFLS